MRNLQNLEALKMLGPVSLFSLYKGSADVESYGGLAHWHHCDLNQSGRSLQEKLRNRLRLLRPNGHYYTDWIHTDQVAQQFTAFLQQVHPQLIVFEELWLSPYLPVAIAYRAANPGCQIVLDNHNVEGLLAQERGVLETSSPKAGIRGWSEQLDLALRPRRVQRLERRALRAVDQMWVCSEADRAAMRSLYGLDQKLRVVPNGVDVSAYGPDDASGTVSEAIPVEPAEPVVLFLGSFAYGPNRVAAKQLIETIYPRLRQQYPAAKLLLVGHEPTDLMLQAAKRDSQITVTGSVPSVLPYLQQAHVMVVPLHHGSGTRLKLLEAFAAGVPVVTTAKGAEGLDVVDGTHVILREDEADLATGAVEVLASPELAQRLTDAAAQLVRAHYSWDAAVVKIQQALAQGGTET